MKQSSSTVILAMAVSKGRDRNLTSGVKHDVPACFWPCGGGRVPVGFLLMTEYFFALFFIPLQYTLRQRNFLMLR